MNIPINEFRPVSLAEMESIRLMDRIDSKFVAPVSLLPALLDGMKPLFMVQSIDGKRIADYETQYFDTPSLDFYLMHHNGKLNRQKIRIRTYRDSGLSFLEVKNKSNKGRTSKKRIQVATPSVRAVDELGEGLDFLRQHALFEASSLVPVLENSFQRMTFVNHRATERITIDIGLTFCSNGLEVEPDGFVKDKLMIIELKQDGRERSEFRNILTDMRIQPSSFSKYCMGIYLARKEVKGNRFKRKSHLINKLINKEYDTV